MIILSMEHLTEVMCVHTCMHTRVAQGWHFTVKKPFCILKISRTQKCGSVMLTSKPAAGRGEGLIQTC